MIEKKFTPKRTICKVTFRLPEEWAKNTVHVVGDFNEWDTDANPLEAKNGAWEATLRLEPNSEYRFRYLLDGENWANDDAADAYVENPYGSQDSVLITGS